MQSQFKWLWGLSLAKIKRHTESKTHYPSFFNFNPSPSILNSPSYTLHSSLCGLQTSKTLGVGGDGWRWLCRHVCQNFPLMLMGGRAEVLECADLGARNHLETFNVPRNIWDNAFYICLLTGLIFDQKTNHL